MTKTTFTLTLLCTALLVGCATGPSGKTFDSPIGEWQTKMTWENGASKSVQMMIVDETRATVEHRSGRILFTATDDPYRWEGYWVDEWAKNNMCADTRDGSNAWGDMVIEFNETYNQFEGRWNYCGMGDTYPHDG